MLVYQYAELGGNAQIKSMKIICSTLKVDSRHNIVNLSFCENSDEKKNRLDASTPGLFWQRSQNVSKRKIFFSPFLSKNNTLRSRRKTDCNYLLRNKRAFAGLSVHKVKTFLNRFLLELLDIKHRDILGLSPRSQPEYCKLQTLLKKVAAEVAMKFK